MPSVGWPQKPWRCASKYEVYFILFERERERMRLRACLRAASFSAALKVSSFEISIFAPKTASYCPYLLKVKYTSVAIIL